MDSDTGVRRIYVEKRAPYAVKARELYEDIRDFLGIKSLKSVRQFIRYDVQNISDDLYKKALQGIFAEPPIDIIYEEQLPGAESAHIFGMEYLPGQFDQRADSAMQCIRFLYDGGNSSDIVVKTAVIYMIEGDISPEDFNRIRAYCINPVDSREALMDKPKTLTEDYDEAPDVKIIDGFITLGSSAMRELYDSLSMAMTFRDFLYIQNYFAETEHRDPTMTELRVLDTYWSDHCRHTTFATHLKNISFDEGELTVPIETTFQSYMDIREELYGDDADEKKPVCLMDMALLAMKKLRSDGLLDDLEESDEINACSIIVPVTRGGVTEEWIVSFKNETHNHPTEIEPFGGAATCLGGAIRDPLSGRSYVYQAMRITGAGDPTVPISSTMKGKLSQKQLVKGAAAGYSSYGNQIGLATGLVREFYHPGFVAKRMEIGAVMGAAPRDHVKRLSADPGDPIILIGGRTGRDGCGGATGSSKAHDTSSLATCGAEVQKGNAPTERKIQRLFSRKEAASLIKKCNDFGAGGVSVAIGELADGILADLDVIKKKYAGLDGTELAISESQERMAVVVAPEDVEEFLTYVEEENLEAVKAAEVTDNGRLVLLWRGKKIVDISRAFLDTNGAPQETDVHVNIPEFTEGEGFLFECAIPEVSEALSEGNLRQAMKYTLRDLNVCSQRGLVEMFDASIGAATVTMPYGGKHQLSDSPVMMAKLPHTGSTSDTDVVTMMSYGYDPYLSSYSPYHGAIFAVMQSIAGIAAAGGDCHRIRLTFQEYFGRPGDEPERWGVPFAALLGAFDAQIGFRLPAIGGKDSMSGTFGDMDVPPTLVSFAVAVEDSGNVLTTELKKAGSTLIYISAPVDEYHLPMYQDVLRGYDFIRQAIDRGYVLSARSTDAYGIFAAAARMAFGNGLGVSFEDKLADDEIFERAMGGILAEIAAESLDEFKALARKEDVDIIIVGEVTDEPAFLKGNVKYNSRDALKSWTEPLQRVFPTSSGAEVKSGMEGESTPGSDYIYYESAPYVCSKGIGKPRVFIPVFPGTNCEMDTKRAFEKAGAITRVKVFKNLTDADVAASMKEYAAQIDKAQIVMFPGGFSAGDEPDGSAKFFATAFRNEYLKDALNRLLKERDGLCLGICNGFQAMIKLGLLPYGEVVGQDESSPTLTYNTIGRHISRMVYTKVVSDKSPWLAGAKNGGVYVNAASHGEGRFVAPAKALKELFEKGQVATRYCDFDGNIDMSEDYNLNGSYMAIEGITSPDGRCFGKMAHSERIGKGVAINIYGEQDMKIFESGVKYFS